MLRLWSVFMVSFFIVSLFFVLWVGDVWPEEGKRVELGGIIVTATRTPKEISSVPASTSVVTKNDIEKNTAQTVDKVLDSLAGVYDRRGKGLMDTQAGITLRGIPGQQRTLILMDGITMNRAYDGNITIGGFYNENLERIEVVRGPFSSLYGGYAMGGVVNIITKMPEKREVIMKSGYGSDNTWGAYTSYGDKFNDRFRVFLSYGYKSTNGYVTDYNVQSAKPTPGITGWSATTTSQGAPRYLIGDKGDNSWRDRNLTVKTGVDLTETSKVLLTFMRSEYLYQYNDPNTDLLNTAGVPVYTYGTVRESTYLAGQGGKTQNIYHVSYETEVSKAKIKASAGLNQHEDNWYVTPGTTAATTRSGGPGTVSSTPSRAYSGDMQATVPFFKRHVVTFGGSYRYNFSDTTEQALTDWKDEDSRTNITYWSGGKDRTYAFFVQDEFAILDNLTVYLGFRQDWWKAFDGYANDVGKAGYPKRYASTESSSFSPKASVVYNPFSQTIVRASVGKAFRPPTLYDLYRTWTSTSGITYAGNPDLKPEKALSWDFGVEQRFLYGIGMKATYFENYIEDMVYGRTVTATLQDKINIGKAEVKGIEIEGEKRFDGGIRIFANYTYNNARVKENDIKPLTEGKRLTMVPAEMFNLGFDLEKGPFTARIVGRYVGKRYSDDENRDRTNNVYLSYDPYFVADAKISCTLMKYVTLSLSVDNIFDRDYYSSYKAPERTWFGEVILRF